MSVQTNSRSIFTVFILLLSAVIQGCATYGTHANSMRDSILAGRVDLALQQAEKEDVSQEDVLASMNKGMLRRETGDFAGSNQILEVAKNQIEELYGVSITENLGAVAVNDTLKSYEGARFEQVLIHVYMAMNFLQMGDEDAARVEVLQADVKMMEWGEQPEEDPFVHYFTGIIYEALGETDEALISYRKAKGVYETATDRHGLSVPTILRKDMLTQLARQKSWDEYGIVKSEASLGGWKPLKESRNFGELIVFINQGLAPVKSEVSIQSHSTELAYNLKIALPTYANDPELLRSVRLSVNGKTYAFETIENIDALARSALDSDMPAITARAIARAVIKHESQKKVEEEAGGIWGLVMTVTNLVTEIADTRSWTTLPQEIQLARVVLPVGQHNVDIEILSSAGIPTPIDVISTTVNIKPNGKTIISRHWAAPKAAVPTTTTPVAKQGAY